MASTAQSVLNGEGTCENICDAQKNSDEDLIKCIKKLDPQRKVEMWFLFLFPVIFAFLMAVFCDCETLHRPCCDEEQGNNDESSACAPPAPAAPPRAAAPPQPVEPPVPAEPAAPASPPRAPAPPLPVEAPAPVEPVAPPASPLSPAPALPIESPAPEAGWMRTQNTLLRSSIIVVFSVAIFAFMVTFFALQNEDIPCATGLGQCTTISCMSGNTYFQGYVFMFVSLTLSAVLLIQDLHREIHRVVKEELKKDLCRRRRLKWRLSSPWGCSWLYGLECSRRWKLKIWASIMRKK